MRLHSRVWKKERTQGMVTRQRSWTRNGVDLIQFVCCRLIFFRMLWNNNSSNCNNNNNRIILWTMEIHRCSCLRIPHKWTRIRLKLRVKCWRNTSIRWLNRTIMRIRKRNGWCEQCIHRNRRKRKISRNHCWISILRMILWYWNRWKNLITSSHSQTRNSSNNNYNRSNKKNSSSSLLMLRMLWWLRAWKWLIWMR